MKTESYSLTAYVDWYHYDFRPYTKTYVKVFDTLEEAKEFYEKVKLSSDEDKLSAFVSEKEIKEYTKTYGYDYRVEIDHYLKVVKTELIKL